MKNTVIILLRIAGLAGLAFGMGQILTAVDGEEEVVEVVEVVEEEPVFHDLQIASISVPLVRDDKVRRYVNIAVLYTLEGEHGGEEALELVPRLRDDVVRSLNRKPIALAADGKNLDMHEVEARFMASGKRVFGKKTVERVVVGVAQASKPPSPKKAEPPKKKKSGGH